MKKAPKVIQPIKKPIQRVGHWCAQLWDGVSGKDFRRLKQLKQKLALYKQNATQLDKQLKRSQQQCIQLEKDLENQQRLLETSQKALEASKQECKELWKELEKLDKLATDSKQHIHTLETELANQTSALANCEANLDVLQRAPVAEAPVSPPSPSKPVINLAKWKIAFVGGHDATRREVTQKLQTDHGLLRSPVEIPPHHDVNISQKQLKHKLAECDLVVSIIGYSSHVLTKSLSQLKDKGALKAPILIPKSRGVSGVVRDILCFIDTHPDLV